jgi:isopentenyl-diphosphate delta-isomerase
MTLSWTRRDTEPHPEHDIILVDAEDRPLGTGAKTPVHEQALLHRAFSVFVVNQEGHWLLQQRAADKYHSPLLWTNACCSHPKPGETVLEAAARRLHEELGIAPPLEHLGALVYHTDFDNGLAEHEYDHLLWAVTDGPFHPNPEEVAALRWIEPKALQNELAETPEHFTFWFRAIMAGHATGPGVDRLHNGA